MTSVRTGSRSETVPRYAAWLTADVVLIALFALLGHRSHYGTLSPSGIAGTVLPFLLAYLAATVIMRPWRRPLALLRTAVPLWIGTAAGGLLLRVLFGEGAALSFQIVAFGVLGLFLIIPRAIAALMRRRRTQPQATSTTSRNQGAST